MSLAQKNKHPIDVGFESIAEFLALIRRGNGAEIEDRSGLVPAEKVPLMIAYYYHTQDWDEKCALVEILRFNEHRYLPAMMLDFLRAPKEFHNEISKGYILLAKALALEFMGKRDYAYYWNNRGLIPQHVSEVLDRERLSYHALTTSLYTQSARTKDFIAQNNINTQAQQMDAQATHHVKAIKVQSNTVKSKRNIALIGLLLFAALLLSTAGVFFIKKHLEVEAQRKFLDKAGVRVVAKVFDKKKVYKTRKSMKDASFFARNFHNGEYVLYLMLGASPEQKIPTANSTLADKPPESAQDVNHKQIVVRVKERTYNFTQEGNNIHITYFPSSPNIYEVLDTNGQYRANYELFVGVFLFLLTGLLALGSFYYLIKTKQHMI